MSREDILLKEYETCQSHNNAIGSQVWVSTTIFMGFNVTLLAALIGLYAVGNVIDDPLPDVLVVLLPIIILSLGVISILCFWKRWLQRVRYVTFVNYIRMRQIENKLRDNDKPVLHKNWLVFGLDEKLTAKQEELLRINEATVDEAKDEINNAKIGKVPPHSGFKSLYTIISITITLWIIVVMTAVGFIIAKLCDC